ncbi:alpha/beta hydrolase [Veronia nyctiphanis]|uniref:Alpha/beta hydrolase n=1 Tax=Veronia nyctiphanis TaxID=1278244 RepID=A0A4Q0YRF6_9GAMM|nr:alpha/beta hydrolase [Veronia nyctiphanis]RXJ73767.1 alpha/beta hydrolase [Veronia nyctiphanis]
MKGIFLPGALLLCLGVWVIHHFPIFGQMAYQVSSSTEALVYGFEKKTVDLKEHPIYFYEANAGQQKPTLLLIHGYSADKTNWLRFARHFTDDFHVVIPDLAGHGETGFSHTWSYTTQAQAGRVKELIDLLDLKSVNIIGSSMGGKIGAYVAANFPEVVSATVLFDPAGLDEPRPGKRLQILRDSQRNIFEVNSKEEFDEFFQMTMSNPPWIPGFVLNGMAADYQQRREELAQIGRDFSQDAIQEELTKIGSPVLLIWGEEDQILDKSSAKLWEQHVPQIVSEIWPGIGHLPMVEAPKKSAMRVRDFLDAASL